MSNSLVEQNRPTLATFVAANSVLIFLAVVGYSPKVEFASIIGTLLESAAAMTAFGILVVLLGGVLPAVAKDRIVFLRWDYALPGHRAFEKQFLKDARLDEEALKKKLGGEFENDPEKQNKAWYKLYRKHSDAISVSQAQAAFLLTREMTVICLVLFIAFAIVVALKPQLAKSAYYVPLWLLLIVETALSWLAARTYGNAFVANVLVEESIA